MKVSDGKECGCVWCRGKATSVFCNRDGLKPQARGVQGSQQGKARGMSEIERQAAHDAAQD